MAVISEGLWRRRFGGDPTLIGKAILLEGEPYVVTGVVGSRFRADPEAELWLPLGADPNSIVNNHDFRMTGRLRPGITLEMAQAQMKLAEAEFLMKFPNGAPGAFTVGPLQDVAVGDIRPALFILFGAVSLVLLIACANVANLLLGRANGRTREMAIRSALGASRWRIIGQLLAESLLLSFAGGLLGVVAGFYGLRTLLALNLATKIPRLGVQGSAVTLDGRVLVFTLLISVLSAILFALLPAFRATRTDMMNAIKESGSRSGNSVRQGRVRSMLVITEMAMAVILLAGATLLVRTFVALRSVDPGFDARNVLTMEMSVKGKRFDKTAAVTQLIREAVRRTATIGGITALATTSSLPLEPNFYLPFSIEGRPASDLRHPNGAQWRAISPHYFEVFRIAKLRGRVFADQDDYRAPGVVIINEAMAKRFWPNEDPVGKRITIGGGPGTPFDEPARQIAGVVADVRDRGLSRLPEPIMYVPVEQQTDALTALGNKTAMMTWVIRTRGEPYSYSADLQRELRIASGGLPVAHIRSMEQVSADSMGRVNFNMTLLSIFAGMALLLAAVGIYGVMASAVQQQTRDISLRMVLGAEARAVRNMVVGQGMRLALIGMGVGVCLSFAITPLMASLLYGVKATDPVVPILVALILSGVALLATYIPAQRATLVDPLIALRWE